MNTEKFEKLLELQNIYIEQLPGKLNALNRVWLKTLHDKDTIALSQLSQHAHNLAGSAGTFGFPSISIEAKKLEDLIRESDKETGLTTDEKEAIADVLQHIVHLVEIGPDKPSILEETAEDESEQNPGGFEFKQLVYVLEDDDILASEIATQLYYFDYEVETFSVVEQAVEAIKLRTPSILIIDVQLPEGDLAGPEFALIFNQPSSIQVPSIFISARDDWQARLAVVRAHGTTYLTKPIDFNDLLERIDLLTVKHTPTPFRILIIDNMEVLAEHYAVVLNNAGMQCKTVTDISHLLEVLSDFKPELILMDICMPQCTGIEAAKIIRQKDELLSVPIVFLSTETDPLQHISAMELGGDDFLQKPIGDDRLTIAVRTRAQRFRQLRSHMHRDGLTGLLNHVTIKYHLESEISRAVRKQESLSFAMIDIDNFKQVNDNYGHPVGDRVIKSVARMLMKRLRRSDLVGRYGGEEFAIILPETDIETARKLLDNIRQGFSKLLQQFNDVQFNCSISVGITQLTPNTSLNTMISTADEALYDAKHSGKNKVSTK